MQAGYSYNPIFTSILIGVIFVALVAFDVVIAIVVGNDATLSKSMQRIGESFPIVIVAWGGLSAHFFCPRSTAWAGWWSELKPFALLAMGLIVFRIAWPQAASIVAPRT